MAGTSLNKQYPWISPDQLLDDPCRAAHELGLIGVHSVAARKAVGAWRWPLVAKHFELVLKAVSGGYVVDLGGAAGPIGYEAITVDYGAPIKSLFDLPGKIDCLFSSHTLEHVADIDLMMVVLREKVAKTGVYIIQVPHWKKERLRPENWPFHQQAFFLSSSKEKPEHGGRCLDDLFLPWCDIHVAEEDDENIFLAAKRVIC